MPAPQATAMKQLARLAFSQNNLKVPDGWTKPSGDPAGQHYDDAFSASEKMTTPAMTQPPLFTAQSMNKYHTDVQKMLTSKVGSYIDGITSAICSAWAQWQGSAALTMVIINGPTAVGGQVAGPPLTPLILSTAPKASPNELKYSNAIATTIGTAWLAYTASIKILPPLPWYPAFTAFPGPIAPPMPNLPSPLMALTQVPASLAPAAMKGQMIGLLGDPQAMYHKELFGAVCDAFDKCFKIWQGATQVTNVLGTGPIPTFAPPYVPVGPVVGGVGNMTPGGFV